MRKEYVVQIRLNIPASVKAADHPEYGYSFGNEAPIELSRFSHFTVANTYAESLVDQFLAKVEGEWGEQLEATLEILPVYVKD